ncbi:MAG: CusA/CzcA family heavy metal efflux RND transporter [Flavobacteriaceae bacterium]|nr:CusA/CzcA family heavy metal efflux RND transporter [Flavobacteriaceae bacterium]
MLNKIIRFSITNKLVIGLLTFGLMLWGVYSLMQLPVDAVPDITNNQVQVITTSPNLAAVEVERLITFPVEITMATIPEIEEIRSFSRFGLSVVTIVFKEDTDIYWARQQVNERLTEAQAQIPPSAGKAGIAPLTTGLGEIYQYVITTKEGYENEYDATELRTIQDWIIKRQLLGTPGIADVSSFGGYLKQYEIAITPEKLNAMDVSISDIFTALEANNENTGGAYIEKGDNALFIRSEGLVNSLEDIGNIVVKNNPNGSPVLIKDVAKVQFGSAVRYGAATRNGKGEVVSAIVMMLKGANSAEVIKSIKLKMEEIRKTLPEGVVIEPFLDRTKLVDNATGTVTKNLLEGALIVIFVLLLLLGNLRAGLITASVIPLALLFAFGMMNVFGVSANLMSLGAIDFGLIVDGAVIIVEATLFHLGALKLSRKLTQKEMDEEVYQSASKIRNSAAFGEIIILIVYLPILALVGTEGKMFGPMAQTVSFAILGAFILSLTYVPMMSALALSKNTSHKPNISDKIMAFFNSIYSPLIKKAINFRVGVLLITAGLFALSLMVFSSMGGEFIPTLEEGDFAVETRVMTGSSLKNTIAATTMAERILLENFPEVEQVVSKIGSGEIPTDPMPIEAADLMIILKDKDDWTSASSREELADKMSEALEVIPGVTFGFQQPIQMRFNELMTGVRQDVAIKIYGEDLEELSNYARQIGGIAEGVDGAADIYIEEVTGVAQIVIKFKRDQIAKYGLNIRAVNQSIQTAFAGASAGLVYEGDRRFDMVVRLDKPNRNNLESVQNLYLTAPDGREIPLNQVAEITIEDGPYQIQRDNTHRRIVVAFNVRNRDVESVVEEISAKIDGQINFEPGYSVGYGGQFENLQEATKRLSYAVPLALLLIFILLYFTFGSIKQGLLIFTAIPLSAIGGIFALYIRGMPFSISAGVGFIALFGVAVLNGIVLIAEFNRLKKEGMTNVLPRIYQGTKTRLRPVIMTAAVASFGFLPMAISGSSGAEVQRPLATVVIGGLISATLLTLIVLPILYYYFEKGIKKTPKAAILLLIFGLGFGNTGFSQEVQPEKNYKSLDELIHTAVNNNPELQASKYETQQTIALQGTSWNLPNTEFNAEYGQTNSIYDDDLRFSVSQRFAFPTVYTGRSKLNKAQVKSSGFLEAQTKNELIARVKSAYFNLLFEKSRQEIFLLQDSIYKNFNRAAEIRFKTGESNLLERATAGSRVAEIKVQQEENKTAIRSYQNQLMELLNVEESVEVKVVELKALVQDNLLISESDSLQNPTLQWYRQQIEISRLENSVESLKLLPELTLGYFNQSFNGPGQNLAGDPVVFDSSDRFSGVMLGLSIPVWAKPQFSRIKAGKLKMKENAARYEAMNDKMNTQFRMLLDRMDQLQKSIVYYSENAIPQAKLIFKQAQRGFKEGEVGYVEYIQGLDRAAKIEIDYLEIINQYNQTKTELEFTTGILNKKY